jgi:glycyl-radical enzyme activating protein
MRALQKGVIFDISRGSINDGPGIRTTVFLKGCPLHCLWCHNPESIKVKPELFFYADRCTLCGTCATVCPEGVHSFDNGIHLIDYQKCTTCGRCVESCNYNALKILGSEMSVEEVMGEVLADQDFYHKSGGGITLSGGEPFRQFEFTLELLKRSKEAGLNTCVETSGYISKNKFKQALPLIDVLLYDYKFTDSENHKRTTGVPNQLILSNLEEAYLSSIAIILRCPIIPGINDTDEHFKGIRHLDTIYPNLLGIEILPYHDMGNNKRASIGENLTLPNLKTTALGTSEGWLYHLKSLGCEKALIK